MTIVPASAAYYPQVLWLLVIQAFGAGALIFWRPEYAPAAVGGCWLAQIMLWSYHRFQASGNLAVQLLISLTRMAGLGFLIVCLSGPDPTKILIVIAGFLSYNLILWADVWRTGQRETLSEAFKPSSPSSP